MDLSMATFLWLRDLGCINTNCAVPGRVKGMISISAEGLAELQAGRGIIRLLKHYCCHRFDTPGVLTASEEDTLAGKRHNWAIVSKILKDALDYDFAWERRELIINGDVVETMVLLKQIHELVKPHRQMDKKAKEKHKTMHDDKVKKFEMGLLKKPLDSSYESHLLVTKPTEKDWQGGMKNSPLRQSQRQQSSPSPSPQSRKPGVNNNSNNNNNPPMHNSPQKVQQYPPVAEPVQRKKSDVSSPKKTLNSSSQHSNQRVENTSPSEEKKTTTQAEQDQEGEKPLERRPTVVAASVSAAVEAKHKMVTEARKPENQTSSSPTAKEAQQEEVTPVEEREVEEAPSPTKSNSTCSPKSENRRESKVHWARKESTTLSYPAWMNDLPVDDKTKTLLMQEKIDEELFLQLTDDDMLEIGVSVESREALAKEIQKRS